MPLRRATFVACEFATQTAAGPAGATGWAVGADAGFMILQLDDAELAHLFDLAATAAPRVRRKRSP